ncbi:MAG: hypothetical protein WBD28_00530 [Candidatus Zixiibacteriota bacterium]
MKKIVSLVLMVFLLFSVSNLSWAKKQKTGKVDDHTFIDSKFAYQLSFLKNWKLKDEKEPSLTRASLVKKNYQIDQLSKQSRGEFNIPTISILADTTSLSFEEFQKALFENKSKKIKNKDEYELTLEFLTGSEIMQESETLVDSIPAKILTMRKPFERLVRDPTLDNDPLGNKRLVNDFLIGYLLLFKYQQKIYVIHFSCERQFFGSNHEEFVKIMEGWKFKR